MRITRSTLRRLIAEESARLLREAAFQEEIEGVYGRGREGEEEEEERGSRMLHVIYHGGSYEGGGGFPETMFIVTDFQANPLDEEAEDVTDEITGGSEGLSELEIAQATKDWLLSHYDVGFVVDEGIHDTETDENDTVDQYIAHLDSVIESAEKEAFGDKGAETYRRAVERGEDEDLFEGDETDDYYGDDDPFGDDEAIEKGYEYVPGVGYKKPGDDSWADIDPDTFSMGEPVPSRALVKRVKPNEFDLEFMGGEEDLDEGDYGDKTDPYERGEGTYGKRARREEIGLTRSSMIWDPTGEIGLVKNDAQADDINYNADLELPDPDRTRPIHQTILGKPGFRPVAELYIDLEYGKTNMDTKVKATIETDDGQTHVGTGRTAVAAIKKAEAQWREAGSSGAQSSSDLTESYDDDDADPEGGYVGFMASDEEMDYLRRGGSYSVGPYADNDDRDAPEANRYERSRKKDPYPVDDIEGSYDDDVEPGDNLSEGRWAKIAGILKG